MTPSPGRDVRVRNAESARKSLTAATPVGRCRTAFWSGRVDAMSAATTGTYYHQRSPSSAAPASSARAGALTAMYRNAKSGWNCETISNNVGGSTSHGRPTSKALGLPAAFTVAALKVGARERRNANAASTAATATKYAPPHSHTTV